MEKERVCHPPSFVHLEIIHLLGNMLGLWILGERLEKIWGSYAFFAFYLLCGIAGNIAVLAEAPFTIAYGASIAVFGIGGAVLITYSDRFRELSRTAKCALALMAVLFAGVVWRELSAGPLAPHTTGLLIGMAVAIAFTYVSKTIRSRSATLVIVSALMLVAALVVRHHYWQLVGSVHG